MTLPLARDHAQDGIRFMAIAAGIFDTPMTAKYAEQVPVVSHLFKELTEIETTNGSEYF